MSRTSKGVQKVNDVADQFHDFKDNLATPLRACVSAVERPPEKSKDQFGKLLLEIKALREDRFQSSRVQNNISDIRSRCSRSHERGDKKYTKWSPRCSFRRFVGTCAICWRKGFFYSMKERLLGINRENLHKPIDATEKAGHKLNSDCRWRSHEKYCSVLWLVPLKY